VALEVQSLPGAGDVLLDRWLRATSPVVQSDDGLLKPLNSRTPFQSSCLASPLAKPWSSRKARATSR
jgi:hypothetical protein